MKELRFEGDEGEIVTESDISAERLDEAKKWRGKLIDQVASTDDALAELYLEGEEISVEQLKKALRAATISRVIVPVVLGSSRHNQGVQPLIDAVIDYLPCPTDIPPARGIHIKKTGKKKFLFHAMLQNLLWGLCLKFSMTKRWGLWPM